MKRLLLFLTFLLFSNSAFSQEILAQVQVNSQVMGGSNQQVYKTLEKNLRDFINNTSWTGKKLQNFEKIKANFALVITEGSGSQFKGTLVVQSVRPVFDSTYESPLINYNDTDVAFDYVENENLVFNERQFSGKNLTDVISFYVYLILAYDADSFQVKGGQEWFTKCQKISQNSQNQNYGGWSAVESPKTRGALINAILNENTSTMRNVSYSYHRAGLDNLSKQDQSQAKKIIFDALNRLKMYENSFQLNPAINLFINTKSQEIFDIFDSGNNSAINITELRQLMSTFSPKYIDSKWNKWK